MVVHDKFGLNGWRAIDLSAGAAHPAVSAGAIVVGGGGGGSVGGLSVERPAAAEDGERFSLRTGELVF